jgi:anti-sigma28 factor (negative regulator of flagellin synthesis)
VLPTSKPRLSAAAARQRRRDAQAGLATEARPAAVQTSDGSEPLRPIGPERLRALREAIRDGSYPTDAEVLGGLERMLGVRTGSARDGDERDA